VLCDNTDNHHDLVHGDAMKRVACACVAGSHPVGLIVRNCFRAGPNWNQNRNPQPPNR
jgi:hypothetical protein